MDRLTLPGSNYGYSATRIGDLDSTAWSLVTIAADRSGSVASFRAEIESCIAEITRACRRSPRADNLMLRVIAFDDDLVEVHGFKPLMDCNPADYTGCLEPGGCTALFDACTNSVRAMTSYAETLTANGFDANGIVFVITDGCDNQSSTTADDVGAALTEAVTSESLSSMLSVLVGVDLGKAARDDLVKFSARAGFDSWIDLGKADAATVARLAAFASRSIALTSTALTTGSSTIRPLTF